MPLKANRLEKHGFLRFCRVLKILPDNPGIATNTRESIDYGYGSGPVFSLRLRAQKPPVDSSEDNFRLADDSPIDSTDFALVVLPPLAMLSCELDEAWFVPMQIPLWYSSQ
ncbi:MAG TPA: hypothetical protein VMT75_04305 [Candidatus Saccharimonadales bacterium]|nr:hypothetical protein [Candidatus Saccharimonadales bacterium]